VRDRQLVIRRELDRRGISLKAIAFDSGLPYSTVVSYFPGERDKEPHTLSATALFALCGVLPFDLLSLVLPDGFQIVRVPEGINHDEIADCMVEYLAEKQRAHHPESECGPALGPKECQKLTTLAVITGGKVAA
jgi:hypothetical protein